MNEKVIACSCCGTELKLFPHEVRRHNFCDRKCMGKYNRRRVVFTCDNCGIELERPLSWMRAKVGGHNFCSQKCMGMSNRGVNNPRYKRGHHIDLLGYVWVLCPSEFIEMATSNGYVLEHRLVMAQHEGRCLLSEEEVHHINGDKSDNRIENLELFASHDEHWKCERSRCTCGTGKHRLVKCPSEFAPMASANGYVYEHRLFMAQVLGFCLDPRWVVHHIDGNRSNNDIENLLLLFSKSAHTKYGWER